MGVVVSSSSALAPITLASTIVGFISFSLTLATFLRVFWDNLRTFFMAGKESRSILTTLRIELEEERLSLREIRRHYRSRGPSRATDVFAGPELDDATLRSMSSTLRRLTQQFEELEQPFLCDAGELAQRRERARQRARSMRRGRRRSRSVRKDPYNGRSDKPYTNRDYGGDDEKRAGYQSEGYEDEEERVEDMYATVGISQRLAWLHSREDALNIVNAVARVQTRRIARQVGEIACMLHGYGSTLDDMRHGINITEDRMSRVVGIRRIVD